MDNKQITTAAPVVLYDSQWWLDDAAAKDAITEFCECNEIDVPAEESDKWWKIISTLTDWMFDDFHRDLRDSKYYELSAVVCGSLGLWTGRHEITPKFFLNLEDAIAACYGSCADVQISIDDGAIRVKGMHHDGTNILYVRAVNPKYIDLAEKLFYDSCDDVSCCDLPDEMFEQIESI